MSKAIQAATNRLEDVAADTSKFIDRFTSSSDKLSGKSSSTVFGCTGGVLGTLGAVVISHFAGLSLFMIGGPLSALGILGGILLYRGPRRFRLERRLAENRLAADEILGRIKALPRTAPPETRDGLWRTYESLTRGFELQSAALLAPPLQEKTRLTLPNRPEDAET